MNKSMIRTSGATMRTLLVAACVVAMPAPSLAAGQNGAAASSPVVDKLAVQKLAMAIRRAIAKLPKDVSVEDAEAAIVYAISQENPRCEIVDPALDLAKGSGVSANVAQAIENVRRSYCTVGTGAITHGGANNTGSNFFSPPVVGIGGGGGGSNYTR